ncbi:lysophospholipase-like protein 1 isoform X2 [Pleuronectes platessa]|uniref:lysophospholipase-like protein 1 isoform X2 n=1 Tax=Pleuronectes platessa TaxID=8262 RepID=UPI00232A5A64|nr:lysophospholipase-like protein 1 isoform X2 [Pleuronectes platessa]
MAAARRLKTCAVSPAGKHSASVIFLHGSGDTGRGLRAWVRDVMSPDLAFSHIKVIYPTAPARPYTPMRGAMSTVWFDRLKISRDCPEDLESIDDMCSTLGSIIEGEVNAGIHKDRVVIVLEKCCSVYPESISPADGLTSGKSFHGKGFLRRLAAGCSAVVFQCAEDDGYLHTFPDVHSVPRCTQMCEIKDRFMNNC